MSVEIATKPFLRRAQGIIGWMRDEELEWLGTKALEHNKIIEVGSYKGRSSRVLADNTPGMVICCDPWSGPYLTDDNTHMLFKADDNLFRQFEVNMLDCLTSGKAMVHRGTFQTLKPWIIPDFIFLDGDHHYEMVKADIQHALMLMKNGGLLAGHDFDDPAWPGVRKAVVEMFGEDFKVIETIWWKEV